MGNSQGAKRSISPYAILLTPEQRLGIYGFSLLHAKSTLTWQDVEDNKQITLRLCFKHNIQASQLHKMQPRLQCWVDLDKVGLEDIDLLDEWKCHPFHDLRAGIGDLILQRQKITPQRLARCNVTYQELKDKHGMSPDIMGLLRYSAEEWGLLGLTAQDLCELSNEQLQRIFQAPRDKVVARLAS